MMGRCMLSDIPDVLFQDILEQLDAHEYASLRQVSQSAWQRTTPQIPYLTLRLSKNSSVRQIQQWSCYTQRLLHVSNIHVHVSGDVLPSVFDVAMQVLSERGTVRELNLLAADSSSSCSNSSSSKVLAYLPSLTPVQHLKGQLYTLRVEGVAVEDLLSDLRELAKGGWGGWKWDLQHLILAVHWTYPSTDWRGRLCLQPLLWTRFVYAVQELVAAFPSLQQLAIRVPPIGFDSDLPAVSDESTINSMVKVAEGDNYNLFDSSSSEYSDSDDMEGFVRDAAKVLDNDTSFDSHDDIVTEVDEDHSRFQAASAQVAAVAGVVKAVLRLEQLQDFTLFDAPDIWRPTKTQLALQTAQQGADKKASAVEITAALEAARARAAAGSGPSAAAGEPLASVGPMRLASVAAAFATLDDCGSWLLQHHPALQKLHISTAGAAPVSMFWQQQVCHSSVTSSSMCVDSSLPDAELLAADLDRRALTFSRAIGHVEQPLLQPSAAASRGDISCRHLESALTDYLSHYSSRPADEVMSHIKSLKLQLEGNQADSLADLLRNLKSLRHLEIELDCCQIDRALSSLWTTAVFNATAVRQSLQSLSVCILGPTTQLPDNLLLPLTAVARGPGSSLTRLKVLLHSVSSAKVARSAAAPEAVSAVSDSGWLQMLRQLKGLRHLKVDLSPTGRVTETTSGSCCKLFVKNLPTTLTLLQGKGITIAAAVTADGDDEDAGTRQASEVGDNTCSGCSQRSASFAIAARPQLCQLCLEHCQLSSPSILASSQLQQLTVVDSSWTGGWPAAAAAWPNLRKLLWSGDTGCTLSNGDWSALSLGDSTAALGAAQRRQDPTSSGGHDIDSVASAHVVKLLGDNQTADTVLQQLSTGFSQLTSLTMQNLPWLTVEALGKPVLHHVAQQMNHIKHVNFVLTDGQYSDFACQWHSVHNMFERAVGRQKMRKMLRNLNRSIDLDAEPEALQSWLQKQLPWADVTMAG